MKITYLAILILTFTSAPLMGHGDLHERIQFVTQEIEKNPSDFELFLQRGSLFLQHQSYRRAIRDFRHCISNGHRTPRHYYLLAKARFELGHYKKCVRHLLKSQTSADLGGGACYLLTRSFEHLGQLDEAAFWLHAYIENAPFVRPEHFLAKANLLHLQGKHHEKIDCLEGAIKQFGYLPGLVDKLSVFYQQTGRLENAVKLQTKILNQNTRKEFALFIRAQLYHEMGDLISVRADLLQVIKEIGKLPLHIQRQKSVVELKENSQAMLFQMENYAFE
ncbi:MAG: hypothetical protein HKN76_03080 [Saprospiraceae bacterium]|nr:hypothetical protein [Saprospiraceae bacterium]